MIGSRTRLTAVAGSMALTMSLAAAPAVVAQDDPASTIQSFMDAVAAKDFEALPSYFCEAEAEQAAQFDLTELSAGMPEGIDVQSLLDAFIFDIQLDSLEVVSQSDTEAVVQVVGSMAMDIDPEPLMPFIETVIEMSGMEADEDTMNMFMGMMMAEFEAQAEDIDGEVTLVRGEERAWVICSDLDFGDDMAEEMAEDDMAEDMAEDDMADDMSEDDMAAEPTEEPTEEDAGE